MPYGYEKMINTFSKGPIIYILGAFFIVSPLINLGWLFGAVTGLSIALFITKNMQVATFLVGVVVISRIVFDVWRW